MYPNTKPTDLRRPGHIFPLRAVPGGVLRRVGQTEASVDLARLAGLPPAGVICEILNQDGTMARRPQLEEFARTHKLRFVTVAQIVAYRLRTERLVKRIAEAVLPTPYGDFRLIAFENQHELDGLEPASHSMHLELWVGCLRVAGANLTGAIPQNNSLVFRCASKKTRKRKNANSP